MPAIPLSMEPLNHPRQFAPRAAPSPRTARDSADRRRQILAAARMSFLQFGFAKMSMDDIARPAGISRPLLYRKYKNKEEILAAVFDVLFDGRYERVDDIVASRAGKREKLLRIYEVLYLEPWAEMMGVRSNRRSTLGRGRPARNRCSRSRR